MTRFYSKGFTLIEILLAASIMSMIIITLVVFLQRGYESQLYATTSSEIVEQGKQVEVIIRDSILNAESIVLPLPGTSSNELILSFTDPAQNPTEFSVSGNDLQKTEGTGANATSLNGSSTAFDTFSVHHRTASNGSSIVTYEFTISSLGEPIFGRTIESENFNGSIHLLNYE